MQHWARRSHKKVRWVNIRVCERKTIPVSYKIPVVLVIVIVQIEKSLVSDRETKKSMSNGEFGKCMVCNDIYLVRIFYSTPRNWQCGAVKNKTLRKKEMILIFPLWIFHLYVATFHHNLHMEYISLSWYAIPELVVPIRISLIEGCC